MLFPEIMEAEFGRPQAFETSIPMVVEGKAKGSASEWN